MISRRDVIKIAGAFCGMAAFRPLADIGTFMADDYSSAWCGHISSKGGVTLPISCLNKMGINYCNYVHITPSVFSNALCILNNRAWEMPASEIKCLPEEDWARAFMTKIISLARRIPIDSDGEILIPDELRDYAAMKKLSPIVFVPMSNWVEVVPRAL